MTTFLERFLKRGAVPPAALSGMTYANYEAARLNRIGFDLNNGTEPAARFVRCAYCGGNLERSMRSCDGCGAPNRAAIERTPSEVAHWIPVYGWPE